MMKSNTSVALVDWAQAPWRSEPAWNTSAPTSYGPPPPMNGDPKDREQQGDHDRPVTGEVPTQLGTEFRPLVARVRTAAGLPENRRAAADGILISIAH